MQHLLNLLAAIALLVWGTHIVRAGVLRVFGENLRKVLARSFGNRLRALMAGMAITGVVQSSTATSLIVTSFVGKGLVTTAAGLAVMLGADIGTGLVAVVLSFDLSWLSPLLILVGVVLYVSRETSQAGRIGGILIGLGLITLSLQLIVHATEPLTQSEAVRAMLAALPKDIGLDILVGAVLTVMAYSSLATVMLTATLASGGLITIDTALGIVVGANLGAGLLRFVANTGSTRVARRLPVGSLVYKCVGVLLAVPLLPYLPPLLATYLPVDQQVVLFNVGFNVITSALFIGTTGWLGARLDRWFREPASGGATARPRHLDQAALSTPSLAIACAAREALHQADVVETMLRGILPVIRNNDLDLGTQLRGMDDTVDQLYSEIKFYLTQISHAALSERESRRWTDIISFTINMEQVGDIIERVLQDIEDKKVRKNRSFSDAGLAEIAHLHDRLIANLRLAMSVFLDGNVHDAGKLLEEKARFRDLEHEYAANHIARLQGNTTQSIETSSLHLDMISDLKRINSHICSIAYPILESAGALSKTRIRHSQLAELPADTPSR